MASSGDALPFSVASVVEDVLQQHGSSRYTGLDLESRKAEEAALRRYEAASWLRKMAGVVTARDLPEEPSVEEFRYGLRSGHILCNVLNQIQPGVVPKVVEIPRDAALIPDGAALSAYQYFENVRNFLVAMQEIGLPTFDASDLEQGGTSARVVNSVLALKSYHEWKQSGANGSWKFSGNIKSTFSCKSFVRKTSEPFTNALCRSNSTIEKSSDVLDHSLNKMVWSTPSSLSRQRKLHLDLDEPVVTSAPWPPVVLPLENIMSEDDKEVSVDGEWVDIVMVNKPDVSCEVKDTSGCLEASSSPFRQKYLQDTSNLYHRQSYNMFTGNNKMDIANSDDVLDDDTATSDSSEQDLHWQYNHATKIPSLPSAVGSKIPTITNIIGSKLATPTTTKGSKLRIPSSKMSQSPAEKLNSSNATPNRIRRQPLLYDGKVKVGSRKQ
ncbi:hypothetical protein QQ045_024760 [Rhodiola kirilowii]